MTMNVLTRHRLLFPATTFQFSGVSILISDEHCKTFPAVQNPSSATSAAVWCPSCARRARQFLAGPLQRGRAMLNPRLLFGVATAAFSRDYQFIVGIPLSYDYTNKIQSV